MIDKIGRPSCCPSILLPSKSYNVAPLCQKISQKSRSSDLVDRYVKMSVFSRRIKICNKILTFWPFSRSKGHKGQVLVMGYHGNHQPPRGQIEIPLEKKCFMAYILWAHPIGFAFTCICTGSGVCNSTTRHHDEIFHHAYFVGGHKQKKFFFFNCQIFFFKTWCLL